MAVYVDVLLVLNYGVDLTLLYAAARLLRLPCRRKRLCLGALVGAIGSLWIFVPVQIPLVQLLFKLLLTLLVGGTAFGFRPWQTLVRGTVAIGAMGGLFAGAMLGLELLFSPKWLCIRGDVVYANTSLLTLLLWIGLVYGLLWLLTPLFWNPTQTAQNKPIAVDIAAFGGTVQLHILPDSGNLLREPFSGKFVLVCSEKALQPLGAVPDNRFRLIPCATVAGSKALQAFLPDSICLSHTKTPLTLVYVAASTSAFPPEYDGVAHPSLFP